MTSARKQTLVGILAGLVIASLLFVGGCQSGRRQIVENTDPAPMLAGQADKDEVIGDAAGKITEANKGNPNSESRATIAEQVRRIMDALRGASWKAVEATVAKIVEERNAAQADAAKLRDEIDRLNRELEAAKSDAQRAAYLGVVRVFAVIGGALTLGGVLVFLWSTYKRAGILLAVAGPVVGGSGLLWGKPWFVATVGLGVLAVGVAVGIRYAWAVIDADKNGKLDLLLQKHTAPSQ